MKKGFKFGALASLVALAVTVGSVPTNTAYAATSATNYTDVRSLCNTGSYTYPWYVVKSVAAPAGQLVVYKNKSYGTLYCAVHYNTTGSRLYMGATISYGSMTKRDYGYFIRYAGPVVISIPQGKCGEATGYVVYGFSPDGRPAVGASESVTICNNQISAL